MSDPLPPMPFADEEAVEGVRLARPSGWPEALAELLTARHRAAFAWGTVDCCMFVADAVEAITGEDIAADLRGEYSDEAGADALLDSLGGVVALADARLSGRHEEPMLARRGDVVCVTLEGRETLGVVMGNGQWAAPGPRGLVLRPMAEVTLAWRV